MSRPSRPVVSFVACRRVGALACLLAAPLLHARIGGVASGSVNLNADNGGAMCNEGTGGGSVSGGDGGVFVIGAPAPLPEGALVNQCQGYLRWNLATLPAGARITAATLTVSLMQVDGTDPVTLTLTDLTPVRALPLTAYALDAYADLSGMEGARPVYGGTTLVLGSNPASFSTPLAAGAVTDLNGRSHGFSPGVFAIGLGIGAFPALGNSLTVNPGGSTLALDYEVPFPSSLAIDFVQVPGGNPPAPGRVRIRNHGAAVDLAGFKLHAIFAPFSFSTRILERGRSVTVVDLVGVDDADTVYTGGGLFGPGGSYMKLSTVNNEEIDMVCWGGSPFPPGNGWGGACSGMPPQGGVYRRWRESDTDTAADWRVVATPASEAAGSRRVSEIVINEVRGAPGEHWIELVNLGPDANLGNWRLEVRAAGSSLPEGNYLFPPATPLATGGVIWLADNGYFGMPGNPAADAFHRNLPFPITFGGATTGGELILFDGAGRARDYLLFGTESPRTLPNSLEWTGPPVPAVQPFVIRRRGDLSTRSAADWSAAADGSNFGLVSPGQLAGLARQEFIGGAEAVGGIGPWGDHTAGVQVTLNRPMVLREFAIAALPLALPGAARLSVIRLPDSTAILEVPLSVSRTRLQWLTTGPLPTPLALAPGQYALVLHLDVPWEAVHTPSAENAQEWLTGGAVDGYTYQTGYAPGDGFITNPYLVPWMSLVATQPPQIVSPLELADGETGLAAAAVFATTGGTAPVAFSVSAGALPDGLTLGTGGAVSGTPVEARDFDFTVRATDAGGLHSDRSYRWRIVQGPRVVNGALPVYDSASPSLYYADIYFAYGHQPYTMGCSFPDGLTGFSCSVEAADRIRLSGATTQPNGAYTVRFTVSDTHGASASRDLPLTVYTQPVILTSALAPGRIGINYGVQHLLGAGGSGPGTWAIDPSTPLPTGLTLADADITGTPATSLSPGVIPVRVLYTVGATTVSRLFGISLDRLALPPYWIRRGLTGGELAEVVFSPMYAQDGFAAAIAANRQAVYIARDGGYFWKMAPLELPDIVYADGYQLHDTIRAISFGRDFDGRPGSGNQTLIVSADSGLWRSDDLGGYWYRIYTMTPTQFHCRGALWFRPGIDEVYCAGQEPGFDPHLYRSDAGMSNWMQIGSEQISAIFPSPTFAQDGTLFAIRIMEELLRSTDGGLTWTQMQFIGGGFQGQRLEISPNYANDRTLAFIGSYGGALNLSSDGGATFIRTAAEFGLRQVRIPADYDPVNNPRLYASGTGSPSFSGGCQMMTSEDHGYTFSPTGTGGLAAGDFQNLCLFQLSPNFANDGTILAQGTAHSALFRSIDRGVSWNPSDGGIFLQPINAVSFAPDFVTSDRMLVATGDGIFYSTNGGRVWKPATLPAPAERIVTALAPGAAYAPGNLKYFAYACPANYGQGCKILRSLDGGQTWAERGAVGDYAFYDPFALQVAANGTLFANYYVGGQSRLMMSTDEGLTFTPVHPSGTISLDGVYKFGISPSFASDQALFAYEYEGNNFYRIRDPGGAGEAVTAITNPGINGYQSPVFNSQFIDDGDPLKDYTDQHTFFWNCARTTDAGQTFSAVFGFTGCGPMATVPGSAAAYAAPIWGQPGLYKSWDGTFFSPLSGGPGSAYAFGHVAQVAVANDGAGAETVAVATPAGLYFSRNGGASFELSSGTETYSDNITAMVVDPGLRGRIFIGTGDNGVAVSLDDGLTANSISGNLPVYNPDETTNPVADLALVGSPPALLVALQNQGVWRLTVFDGGGAWTQVLAGDFRRFRTDAAGSRLYAANAAGTSYACDYSADAASACEGGEWAALGADASLASDIDAAPPDPFTEPDLAGPRKPSGSSASLWASVIASGARFSANGGATWSPAAGGNDYVLPATSGYTVIKPMTINPATGGREVAIGHSSLGVFLSRDGGDTWRNVSGPGSGLEATSKNVSTFLTAATPQGGTDLLVGVNGAQNGGVYLSGDGGEHWTQVNQGFDPNTLSISTLVKSSCAGCPVQYYSGSYGGGLYTRTIAVNPPPAVTGWCTGAGCTCGSGAFGGPVQGGTTFKLCGTGMLTGAVVEFDGVAATGCTAAGGTSVTCTATPPHAAGNARVRVRNPDTRAHAMTQPFAYAAGASRAGNSLRIARSTDDAWVSWTCASCSGGTPARLYRAQNPALTSFLETYNGGANGAQTGGCAPADGNNSCLNQGGLMANGRSYFWVAE